MAKKTTIKEQSVNNTVEKPKLFTKIKQLFANETFRFVAGLLLVIFAVYLILAFSSFFVTGAADQSVIDAQELSGTKNGIKNYAGSRGAQVASYLINDCFGVSSFFIVLFLGVLGLRLMRVRMFVLSRWFIVCTLLLLWFSLFFGFAFSEMYADSFLLLGGMHGYNVGLWLESQVGTPGVWMILLATAVCFFIYLSARTIEWLRKIFSLSFLPKRRSSETNQETKSNWEDESTEMVDDLNKNNAVEEKNISSEVESSNEDENDVKENEIENEPQEQQEQQQQQQEQHEPNATTPQNNNNETPQTQITEITNEQLPLFLHKMGMCSKPNNDSENSPINKSSIQQRENTLITDISNSLKNTNDKIPIQNLRKFLLCVVGLHYYTLYEEFKSTHTNKEIEDLLSKSNTNTAQTSQDKLQFFILTQDTTNSALINQSNDQNNKYISYSSKDESSIIIPITKAKKIKKDFDLFAITYISSRSTKASTNPSSSSSTNNTDKPLFYPHIDKNSKKMSQKSRDKVMENTNAPNQPYSHMDYIDRIIMARKKKLAENQRIKEENDKKLLLECTFKPKMQNKSTIKKTTGANRFKELFIKGTEKVKSRKNRTQDDFENEKNKKECTFKPDINHDNLIIPETRFTNDIYGDKSYQIFYERMKNGKTERQIKEAALNRFGMDDTLKEYLKQKKQKEYALHSGGGDDNEMQSDNDNQNGNGEQGDESGNNNQNESDNKEEDEVNDESGNDNQQSDEGGDGELDKKEGIPLLIIDVNIRQGVKKKIYVFEGDTPEGLAEKFSKEHNLEPQTKEKLQNLINNHMLRLLTRIDEENQSLSEKSGTTHMQKNQS